MRGLFFVRPRPFTVACGPRPVVPGRLLVCGFGALAGSLVIRLLGNAMLLPFVLPCVPSVDGNIGLIGLRRVGCGVKVESVSLESHSFSDMLDCEVVEPVSLVIDCRREGCGDTVVGSGVDSGRGAEPPGDRGGVPYLYLNAVRSGLWRIGLRGIRCPPFPFMVFRCGKYACGWAAEFRC
eukprot:703210-Rhodomonas_salina.1